MACMRHFVPFFIFLPGPRHTTGPQLSDYLAKPVSW